MTMTDQNPQPEPDFAARIKELEEQVARLTDVAGRAQADLQNAKVRMQRDGDDMKRFAVASVVLRLLPVVDNFQRAFAHLPADLKNHEWIKGVYAIEQTLIRELTDMGLKKMDVLGTQVDTARHEVITVGPGEEGVITEVLEDGYELHGKVIRPAKVKVGAPTLGPSPDGGGRAS
jgi:molecular chaperone GrpE